MLESSLLAWISDCPCIDNSCNILVSCIAMGSPRYSVGTYVAVVRKKFFPCGSTVRPLKQGSFWEDQLSGNERRVRTTGISSTDGERHLRHSKEREFSHRGNESEVTDSVIQNDFVAPRGPYVTFESANLLKTSITLLALSLIVVTTLTRWIMIPRIIKSISNMY